MIRKLLKYDFKSMLRFWYVAAITTAVLTVIGCGCMHVVNNTRSYPEAIIILSWIFLAIVILSYLAFSIVAIIIIFARFYKNLFTDEGYLTFTLPVKKITVLNSKIISGFTILFATSLVIFAEICLLLNSVTISFGFLPGEMPANTVLEALWRSIKHMIEADHTALGYANFLTVLLTCIATTLFQLLFIYVCITIGSIVAKKAKVALAIAFYYIASSSFGTVMGILYTMVVPYLSERLGEVSRNSQVAVSTLIIWAVFITVLLGCALCYAFLHKALDRKLNLA